MQAPEAFTEPEMWEGTGTSLRIPRASFSLVPKPPHGKASLGQHRAQHPGTWLCLHPSGTCPGFGGQRAAPRRPRDPAVPPHSPSAGGLGGAGAGRGPGSEPRCRRGHKAGGVSLERPLPQGARAKHSGGLSQWGPGTCPLPSLLLPGESKDWAKIFQNLSKIS